MADSFDSFDYSEHSYPFDKQTFTSEVIEEGSYATTYDLDLHHDHSRMHFPATGVELVENLTLGGHIANIGRNNQGKLEVSSLMPLLMSGMEMVSCPVGKVLVRANTDKMRGYFGLVHGVTLPPDRANAPPSDHQTTPTGRTEKKKIVEKVKSWDLEVSEDVSFDPIPKVYKGTIMGNPVTKAALSTSMFEVDATGSLMPGEGLADLGQLLELPGIRVWIQLRNTSCPIVRHNSKLNLSLLARHPNVNKNQPLHLFSTAPVNGISPGILKPGLFGQEAGVEKGLKDLEDLPWGRYKPTVIQMLKPLVEYAIKLNQLIGAGKHQIKTLLEQISTTARRMETDDLVYTPTRELAGNLLKLYSEKRGEAFNEVLACYFSLRGEDRGQFFYCGTSEAREILKGLNKDLKRPREADPDEDESDEDESDEDESDQHESDEDESNEDESDGNGLATSARSTYKPQIYEANQVTYVDLDEDLV